MSVFYGSVHFPLRRVFLSARQAGICEFDFQTNETVRSEIVPYDISVRN